MKILISGASGYVGRHLVGILRHRDYKLALLGRSKSKLKSLFGKESTESADNESYSNGDRLSCSEDSEKISFIDSFDEVKTFNPDAVIHLATFSTSRNDFEIIDEIIDSNVAYGVKLLSVLSQCSDFKFFINTGSFAEYREGPEKIKDAYLYTATKSAFRYFVDYYSYLNKFKYVHIVPYTVYGSVDLNKKIIDYALESINADKAVNMSPGNQRLDFIHVNDLVDLYVYMVDNWQKLEHGRTYFAGTGVGTTIRELVSAIENLTSLKCNINWGALDYRPLDVMEAIAPIDKMPENISWRPKISLKEGLKEILKRKNLL